MMGLRDVLSRRRDDVPFDIVRAAYCELHVTNLEASRHFYVDLLGLVETARTADTLYLRGWEEQTHHALVLRERPTVGAARLAFRVRTPGDLDAVEQEFVRRECEVERVSGALAGMGDAVRVWDPFGFPLEFFHEIARFPTQLQRFDLHRGAPIMRFDHLNIHAPSVEETTELWLDLGFHCTEYISTDGDDERLTGCWLTRKSLVHDLAMTAGTGPRLHHTGLATADPLSVLRACDQLAAAGHADVIERGPGRHGVSNAFFVYLRDPDGHRIELYACDYYTGDPDHPPLRWSVSDPSCRSFWGAKAPDSWYDESSVVLDPNGNPTPIREAGVDERTARSVLMA